MSSTALRHFLERAVQEHAANLDQAFPGCFDWHRFCRDVPTMAERATEGAIDASDPSVADPLIAQADVAFRITHVVALAVLCVAEDREGDPDGILEEMSEGTDDDEEERFAVLVSEVLGPAEEFLHDPETELDERGVEVQRLFAVAWPTASEYLAVSGLFGEVEGSEITPGAEAVHPFLAAAGRLATLLAALRWMARYPEPA